MNKMQAVTQLLRYYSLTTTTNAGSGHPTSCLSATDLMAVLFTNQHFHYDITNPSNPDNDRLIFSKGHAAPLFYALWAIADAFPREELMSLRKLDSRCEGHPTMKFPYTEVPTGSLGQGLAVGIGMALNAKYLDKSPYRTFVLMGDSEMAEGSVWEAMQIATHYKLDNLVGIIDANRLGQRGETLHGHDLLVFEAQAQAFGWHPIIIDGHNHEYIDAAYKTASLIKDKPTMIIARTFKGKGVSFLEDKEGKHGVAVSKDDLQTALDELGKVDTQIKVSLPLPTPSASDSKKVVNIVNLPSDTYVIGSQVATREAYGTALGKLAEQNNHILALDAETSNSTFADSVKKTKPEQFFEMYIAEQTMLGVGTGLARRGKIPFMSTFSAFLTRAYDQIRMASYGQANIKIVGSHCGVSIGEDGTSQMGLEDISMIRSVFNSVVLYPSDAISTIKLVSAMANYDGLVYMRTTRAKTTVLYQSNETFEIGGSKVHKLSDKPHTHVIIGAGITLHEALKAQKLLAEKGVNVLVVDLYSIKPIDSQTLQSVTKGVKKVIVVEDHYEAGGIAEAVRSVIGNTGVTIESLAVRKMPQSGKPEELLRYEQIDAEAIQNAI